MASYIREMPKEELIDSSGRMSKSWEIWFNDLRMDVLPKLSQAVGGNLAVVTSDGVIRDGGVSPDAFAGTVHTHTSVNQGGVIPSASWTQAAAQPEANAVTTPTVPVPYSSVEMQAIFNTLTAEINALVVVVNGLIAKLQDAGVMQS